MKKILSLYFALTYLLIIDVVKAQETYNFNQLTIRDGLSSGSITCFLQDKKGFIWIGTTYGLNRYDGHQIHVYKNNPQNENSIGGNYIRCLFEDSRNHLWIGLRGRGLSRMDLATGTTTTFRHNQAANSLSYNDVSGIVEDNDGKLWIAVDRGGLDMYDPVTNNFTNYRLIDQNGYELNNALTGIAIDNNQKLWLSSWGGGVYCFDIKTKSLSVHHEWDNDNDNIRCKNILNLYIDEENIVWISTSSDGLYALYPDNKFMHFFEKERINSTFSDNYGNIWIAISNGGIKIINKTTGKMTHLVSEKDTGNGLLSNTINYIYMDNNSTMWVGTSVGVNYYNPLTSQFSWIKKHHRHSLSLSDEEVFAILKDRRDNIWIGGTNGIDIINANRTSIKNNVLDFINLSNYFFYFQSICEAQDGNIWIGSYANCLIKYDPLKNNFSKIEIPPPKGMHLHYSNVYNIYEDWDNSLWLSTELGAINYNPVTGIFTPLFESNQIIYPEDKTHVTYRDRELELWVGTEAGLRRYSRDLKIREIYVSDEKPNSIINDFITTILEDNNGTLWIGTMGGLHRFDKKENKFELIKRPDVPYGDPVFGLSIDANDIIWMSTIAGIIKFDHQNMNFIFYDASDGLQNKDFRMRAFYQAADGELFFGGKNGLNTFYPENIQTNEQSPAVVITDFQIFNNSVVPQENGILERHISETKEIRIKHSQSVISFSFVALNFISSSKNRYKYKMEGFDHDWVSAKPGQRSVTYTNLDHGEYIFKVIGANNDGIWSENPATIKLIIQPPFRNTFYAYLIYFAILCGLIYLLFFYFMIREKDKTKLKIAQFEAARIREIDNMKNNLFTNVSHEFRTPLSLISGPLTQIIEKKEYPKEDESMYTLMLRNCQRLTRLVNQLLDYRKIEAGKLELNMRYEDIIRFITDLASTFSHIANEKNIQYVLSTTVSEKWMDFDSDKVDKILYNLISNAFQYTPEMGKIVVGISEVFAHNISYIQISVTDTGIGISDDEKQDIFTAFYQSQRRKSLNNGGSGIGLTLTKELVELHNGIINVESEIDKGSVFTVQLPVNENQKIDHILSDIKQSSESDDENDDDVLEKDENISADMILIIEDSSDMRVYLETMLSEQFRIITAKDGEEGFHKAQEYIPDLIICDIMMPVMDGMELLKAVKGNEKTNHIPIILLTARHTESTIMEGYQTGADDYITKPFSEKMLKIRIDNILSIRRKMWENYKQSKNIDEYKDKLAENPQKQAFVNKINELIIQNISKTDFGIEILAGEMRMSPKQMLRKVRALMDTTPFHVILQVKMTQAAKMLLETNMNISEIAFEVGYEELSNFSRAFKKYYNMSPREYIKLKRKTKNN